MVKQQPVFIMYEKDIAPSDDVPGGYRAGALFEVATPNLAKKVHPDATILRYADGSEYVEDKSKRKTSRKSRKASDSSQTSQEASTGSETNDSAAQDSED